jgi:hypothetical protein
MNILPKLQSSTELTEDGTPPSYYFQKIWQSTMKLLQGLIRPALTATPIDNGDLVFEFTTNTTLKIKVKGYDGVVRSVSLTLV